MVARMTTCDFSKQFVFTRVEAAQFLRLSTATLDRLTACGKLRPSRATRRRLFSREELHRFLAESCERTPVKHRDFVAVPAAAKEGGE